MTTISPSVSYLASIYPAGSVAAGTQTTPSSDAGTDGSQIAPASVTISSLPLVQMPSDMFAAIQSGAAFRTPDPARTAAQNATPAYAIIKDAKTGQTVGGVWPGAAVVSKPNIAIDNRITGNTNWSQVTQYLAQDIQQGTGADVTIQYFQPGDPSAPTFGSVMGTSQA